MINWFHSEEEYTVGMLENYFNEHRGAELVFTYEGGESYLCKYDCSYESDNEYEVEEGLASEPEDYYALAVDPVKTIKKGKHLEEDGSLIEVSYRDFPVLITTENGEVVYKK